MCAADTHPDLVELASLDTGPGFRPVNGDHVAMLAEVLDRCPPVLVHRPTGLIVDGRMRVQAARALGRQGVPVVWMDGDGAAVVEAWLQANSRHGLPLTLAERRDGARRLIELAPERSNRSIARVAGISESTVRRLRPPASGTHVNTVRVGEDGRSYPVDGTHRQAVHDLLARSPGMSDRAIAEITGVSPTTVGRIRCAESTETASTRKEPVVDTHRGWLALLSTAGRWVATLLRRLVQGWRAAPPEDGPHL